MDNKTFLIIIVATLISAACGSTPSALNVQPTRSPTVTPDVPTLSPAFTATVTAQPSSWIAMESIPTATPTTPVILPDTEIPVFPGVQKVRRNLPLSLSDERKNTIFYGVSTNISEIEKFYSEEMVRKGWEWVYTQTGESLITTVPAPALMMEFKKEDQKLGITAHEFMGELIVLARIDISGTELISNYIGAIAGGYDLIGAPESAIKPNGLHFSSTLLEFTHPSDWLASDQLMRIFESDVAINYYPNKSHCSVHMKPCFVTFSVSKGFHFDTPISIRVHPRLANLTLERADAQRWEELNSSTSNGQVRYNFPEDLTPAGTLETIEVRMLTLADDTRAIQRVYRWKQKDVQQSIIGTYTLFASGEFVVEFHTDFTSDDWKKMYNTVEQVIASIKVSQ